MGIIDIIQRFAPADVQLARMFESVQEYSELYLIAKQRQKGCDGMGEVATLKDELIYIMNGMILYCKEKRFLSGDISYAIDEIADDTCKTQLE